MDKRLVNGSWLFIMWSLGAIVLTTKGPELEQAHARVEPREPCFTCAELFLLTSGWGVVLDGAARRCGFGAAAVHQRIPHAQRDEASS